MAPVLPGTGSKWRLIGGALLLGLLLSGGTLWLTLDLREQTIATEKRQLTTLGTLVGEAAERAFQSIDLAQRDVLADMRQKGVATAADLAAYAAPQALHISLKNRISALPQAEAMSVVDSAGIVLNSSRGWPSPVIDLGDRDYFIGPKSDPALDGFITRAVVNRADGHLNPLIVRRITAPDGRFLGVVLGAIRLSYFESLYQSVVLPGDGSIALMLGDGRMLMRVPPAPEFVNQTFPTMQLFHPGGSSGVVENIAKIGRRPRYISVHPLVNYPAMASVSIDIATALAPWRKEAALLGGATTLLDLALAAGVTMTLRQMTAQRQLASAAGLEAASQAHREADRAKMALAAAADRSAMLANLATAFEQQVGQMSRAVATGAGHVQTGASTVADLAGDTTARTRRAAANATAAAADVNAMAEATKARTGSIEAVASQAERSAELVRAAAGAAQDADATMATLTTTAAHIGQIVNLISGFAQQTNLLALNATIEAARAGESGRGFAVVAGEIKTLSKAVSQATQDITRQIHGMQTVTTQSAAAMRVIREFVTTVDTIAGDITRSMEDQRAATLRIADTMVSAASGTMALSADIGGASLAATDAGATAATVQAVARTLAGQADALRAASDQFLVQVHAA
jgi:methyl-accepting chemotaxis protein